MRRARTRPCRERVLQRLGIDGSHQAPDVLALARERGTARETTQLGERHTQLIGQIECVEFRWSELEERYAEFLGREGGSLARGAAGALCVICRCIFQLAWG
jgi:hypothetical protein